MEKFDKSKLKKQFEAGKDAREIYRQEACAFLFIASPFASRLEVDRARMTELFANIMREDKEELRRKIGSACKFPDEFLSLVAVEAVRQHRLDVLDKVVDLTPHVSVHYRTPPNYGGEIVRQLEADPVFFKKAQDWLSSHPRRKEIVEDLLDALGPGSLKPLEDFLKPVQKGAFRKYMATLRRKIADSPDYEPYEGNFNYDKQHMSERLRLLETYTAAKSKKPGPTFGND